MLDRSILLAFVASGIALAPSGALAQTRGRRPPAATTGTSAAPTATPSAPVNAPPAASPQEVEARQHFERGLALFQTNDFNGALAEFQAAYDLSHRSTVLYNIGVTHQNLHHYPEAARAIEQYLREATITPERRAQVETGLNDIRNFIAHVRIVGVPDGATVTIDGEIAGTAPFANPIAVGTGRHVFLAHLDGYRDAQDAVLIAGGQERDVRLEMRSASEGMTPPVTTTLAVQGAPAGAAIEIDGHAAVADQATPVTAGEHTIRVRGSGFEPVERRVTVEANAHRVAVIHVGSPRMSPLPFVAAAGLTIASGVLMGVFGGLTQSTRAEFDALTIDQRMRAEELASQGNTQRTLTNVFVGTTVGFGIATVVTGILYFRSGNNAAGRIDVAAGPRPEGGGEASIRVRF